MHNVIELGANWPRSVLGNVDHEHVKFAKWRVIVRLVAVLFFVKASAFALLVTPLWATPDETGHFSYIEDLAEGHYPLIGRALMSREVTDAWTGPASTQAPNWIAQHPPLYYALDTPVLLLARAVGLNFEYQVRSARLLTSAFGALTLLGLAYFIFRVTNSMELSLACEIFLSATPMYLHLSSGVTHDTLLACTGVWAAEKYACWVRYDNFRDAVLVAAFLALGAITKITALALAVPLMGMMVLRMLMMWHDGRIGIFRVLGVGFLAFFPSSVWMLFNTLIFGNPLVDSSILSTPVVKVPIGLWSFTANQPFWQHTFINYVGLIGWAPHGALEWFQISHFPLTFFTAAGIVGCWMAIWYPLISKIRLANLNFFYALISIAVLMYVLRRSSPDQAVTWFCLMYACAIFVHLLSNLRKAINGDRESLVLLTSAVVVLFFSFLYLGKLWCDYDGSLRATHGRYFYPVLPFAFVLLATPWKADRMARLALALSVFAMVVCDGFYLAQVYKFYGQIH